MTSKVGELRKNLIAELGAFQMALFRADTSDEQVDSLISAVRAEGYAAGANHIIDTQLATAHAEGVAEGEEVMVKKIQKAAYRCKPGEMLHINNSIPTLVLVSSVVNPEDTDFEPKHYRCTWNREPFTSCEDYRKAGGQAEHCPWFEDKDDHLQVLPASVLAPTKEEKNYYAVGDNGESGESH